MSRILIIEDQADIRRLIRWTLEPDNHELFEAGTGAAGLASLQRARPDLIVLDVMMPGGMDGYEVCTRLRADPAWARTPVVMLTARAALADRQAAEQAGATAFLAKPFSPLELVRLIEKLLGDAARFTAGAGPARPGPAGP